MTLRGFFGPLASSDLTGDADDDRPAFGADGVPLQFEYVKTPILVARSALRAGASFSACDRLIVGVLQRFTFIKQEVMRTHLQKFLARIAGGLARGYIDIDKTHGVAVNQVNRITGYIHGGTKSARFFVPRLLDRIVACSASVTGKSCVVIEYGFAAHADETPVAVTLRI